jgi:membrane protein implicated in regulation of membrane protease activity
MRSRIILVVALASLLGAAPAFASAGADATVPPPAWDGPVLPITAVVVVAVTLAVVALLLTRRRDAGPQVASAAAERAEDHVAAALQRRTLRRGRLRLDDEAMRDAGETPAAAAPARPARRSG